MACPYFCPRQPIQPGSSRNATLPLGDSWDGLCYAVPDAPWQPGADLLHPTCNLGYARGACPRFPSIDGPDAVRFTVSGDDGASLRMYYVVERDHLPFAHGAIEYSVARGTLLGSPLAEVLQRQARAYAESYLRRKPEASGR